MAPTLYFGYIYIHLWEIMALPFYLLIIYLFANRIKQRRIENNPLYKFYLWGLFAKIFGGLSFVLIYLFFYHGGDTTGYFESSMAMNNLFFNSPFSWVQNELGSATSEHFSLFSMDTGYPLPYLYFDVQTYMVIRIISPLLIFTFSSYLLTTVLLDWIAFSGIWRLFLVFCDHYPNRKNLFAFAILFFPSVIFWSSGILKDTITLSCTGWVVFCIHRLFVLKKNRFRFFMTLCINIAIIISIKSYILITLLPGTIMWIFSNRIAAIRNAAFRFLIIPIIFVVSVGGTLYVLSQISSYMGKFALEKVISTALATQHDLKQDYYHGHSFDIGTIDPTPMGLLEKFPVAFIAGMYRPFLWESGNIVMFISGLENTLILILTLTSIFRTNLVSFFRKIFREPILFFSISYSIIFAFSVGLSTSNFGSLVRFKVAYLPFFLCALFILIKRKDEETELSNVRRKSNSLRLKLET
jgi:hypothetical protein